MAKLIKEKYGTGLLVFITTTMAELIQVLKGVGIRKRIRPTVWGIFGVLLYEVLFQRM